MSSPQSKDPSSPKVPIFPYIVLPTLSASSGDGDSGPQTPKTDGEKQPRRNVQSGAKLAPSSSGDPGAVRASKVLTKQYAATIAAAKKVASASASPSKDLRNMTIRQEALKAHVEMRKSPRSFYTTAEAEEEKKFVISSSSEHNIVKLDLEALSQIFPHRVTNPPKQFQARAEQKPSPVLKTKPVSEKHVAPTISSSSFGDINFILNELKTRLDGLTVHVKQGDGEMTKLRQHVVELQLLVLKEQKAVSETNDLMERLTHEMETLSLKLDSFESKLVTQESNILNKLLLIDEMGEDDEDDSDSDSDDYGRIHLKPANWICASSSSSSNTSTKVTINGNAVSKSPKPNQNYSGINSLKECVNWVPIAPDFDKLLNVIALLNFKMDKNQSMKVTRNGNEAGFKHADSTQLILYKNGLVLGSAGFRSYATLSVIKLINEIFSGYFPTELHAQFPDGVIFVVTDKRSVLHDLSPGFNGTGNKLSESPSSTVPTLTPSNNCSLPPLIVKNSEGSFKTESEEVISVSKNSSSPPIPLSPLPDLARKIGKGHKLISLKLKNVSDGKSWKLRVPTSATVDEVLEHLRKHLQETGEESSPEFDIVLPHPYGILSHGSASLKEYGILTNSMVYIQPSANTKLLTLSLEETEMHSVP